MATSNAIQLNERGSPLQGISPPDTCLTVQGPATAQWHEQVCYSKCTLLLLLLCAVSGSRPCMSIAMEPWRDTEGGFRDERWGPLGCPCSSGPTCGQPGSCPLPAGHSGRASAGRTSDRAGFKYEPVRADLSPAESCQQTRRRASRRLKQDEGQAALDQYCSQSMLAVVNQQACTGAGPRVNKWLHTPSPLQRGAILSTAAAPAVGQVQGHAALVQCLDAACM